MYVKTTYIYSACCMWHKNQLKANNKKQNLDGVNDSKLGEWVKEKENTTVSGNNWITVMKYRNKHISIYLQTYIWAKEGWVLWLCCLLILFACHEFFMSLETVSFCQLLTSSLNIVT